MCGRHLRDRSVHTFPSRAQKATRQGTTRCLRRQSAGRSAPRNAAASRRSETHAQGHGSQPDILGVLHRATGALLSWLQPPPQPESPRATPMPARPFHAHSVLQGICACIHIQGDFAYLREDVESAYGQNAPGVWNLSQEKIGYFDEDRVKEFGCNNATQVDWVLAQLLMVPCILLCHLLRRSSWSLLSSAACGMCVQRKGYKKS